MVRDRSIRKRVRRGVNFAVAVDTGSCGCLTLAPNVPQIVMKA